MYLFEFHYISCPVCGCYHQFNLLNHVSRDHSMSLKPVHLSYKCTVCTASFCMYKLFDNHVYLVHRKIPKYSNKKTASNDLVPSSSSSSLITSTSKVYKLLSIRIYYYQNNQYTLCTSDNIGV